MSESESFRKQPRSGTSNHSQTSHQAVMRWLLKLARDDSEHRTKARIAICRLAESEARLTTLRNDYARREADGWTPRWKRQEE